MILRVVEYLMVAFVAYAVIAEIIAPLFQGKPTFPSFRRSYRLRTNIALAEEEVVETELEKELQDKVREADEARKHNKEGQQQ